MTDRSTTDLDPFETALLTQLKAALPPRRQPSNLRQPGGGSGAGNSPPLGSLPLPSLWRCWCPVSDRPLRTPSPEATTAKFTSR